MDLPVLILHANGTNRDRDVAWAVALAGGRPEIVHINQLVVGERSLLDYRLLILPGGFSYGDDLGAGKLWALDLHYRLGEQVARFVELGRPLLGICNGFQALIKSGLLPGGGRQATLTRNANGHFECRWVRLRADPASPCVFTRGLSEDIECPVAHGEGNFQAADDATLNDLAASGQIALTYVNLKGECSGYPVNPNGSQAHIAGLCNPGGTVFGLMPHPEDHIQPIQHPTRRGRNLGLALFKNGIEYARQI